MCIYVLFLRSLLVGDCKWNNEDINKEDVIHLPNEDIFRPSTNSQMTIFYDKEYMSPAIVNESEEEVCIYFIWLSVSV